MRKVTRRASHPPEADTEGTWAISYGDMITLLLSFFVLFFTMDPKKEKAQGLMDSLKVSLADLQSGQSGTSGSDIVKTQPKVLTPQLDVAVKEANLHFVDFNKKLIVDFNDISFFKSGEIQVTDEGVAVLRAFAQKYLPYAGSYMLQIQAFTDMQPVRELKNRRYKDNLELSALRAIAAMRVLQQFGLPLSMMTLSGLGEIKNTHDFLLRLPSKPKTQIGLAATNPVATTSAGPDAVIPVVEQIGPKRNPANILNLSRKVLLVIMPRDEMKEPGT